MYIHGLQRLTLLDFPGHLACTVFLAGCNLRCPFCHNSALVLPNQLDPPVMEQQVFLDFLSGRKGKLTGVCITGGEPTLHPSLPELIQTIKAMGFQIKLDTNGTNPKMLAQLLEANLLDYVAMDIKNSPERYTQTCGGVEVLDSVKESVTLLMQSGIDYEFRSTVCHPLHDEAAIAAIGQWLQGAKAYYLQQFVDSGNLIGSGMTPPTKDTMEKLQQAALPYIKNTILRGI